MSQDAAADAARTAKRAAAAVLLAAIAWLVVGAVLVPQRAGDTLTVDDRAYIAMAGGHYEGVVAPFRFRVLLPWLAFVTGTGGGGIAAVNYLVNALVPLTLFFVGRAAGARALPAAAAATCFWPVLARLHERPWVADGVGTLAASLLLLQTLGPLASPWRWAALVVSSVGALAREGVALLAAALLRRDARLGVAAVLAGLLAHGAMRLLLRDPTVGAAPMNDGLALGLRALIARSIDTYGYVWVYAALGLWRLLEARPELRWPALVFAGASLLQTAVGSDTHRLLSMFSWPMVAAGAAVSLDARDAPRWRIPLFVALGALVAFAAAYTRHVGIGFGPVRIAALGVAVVAEAVHRLRRPAARPG